MRHFGPAKNAVTNLMKDKGAAFLILISHLVPIINSPGRKEMGFITYFKVGFYVDAVVSLRTKAFRCGVVIKGLEILFDSYGCSLPWIVS
jgi:hypothetical protein